MKINKYDRVVDNEEIGMGTLYGSSKVLYVKAGQGSTVYGEENKYLKLAEAVNEKYGFSVVVSKTMGDTREAFEKDIRVAERLLGMTEMEIYYLGISKGGLLGIWYGADEERIVKMLSVNAPLMLNFHNRTVPGVKQLGTDKLTMLYGTLDPSYKYLPFAERYAKIELLEGADHNLGNSADVLLDVTEKYLLG